MTYLPRSGSLLVNLGTLFRYLVAGVMPVLVGLLLAIGAKWAFLALVPEVNHFSPRRFPEPSRNDLRQGNPSQN